MEDLKSRTPENAPKEPKVHNRYKLDIQTDIEVRDDGVFLIEAKVDKTGKPFDVVKQLATSTIDVKGVIDPIDADDQSALLVCIDGRDYTVRRELLTTGQDIGRWLAARSAFFNPTAGTSLARMFLETRPPRIVGYTRNGWARNGAFVVGESVLLGEGRVVDATGHASSGTFEDWEREVLGRAHHKPMWQFALLVGMSSALLKPLGIETGTAFNPYGTSGSGKTDALRASAGVWGNPATTLKSFVSTANALENLFEEHNHMGLTLDEMRTVSKGLLADFAYLFGNGAGKERMKSNAEQVRRRSWLLNCFMSSEKSVESIFDAMDETQAAGMITRLIDFDARRWYPIIDIADVRAFEEAVNTFYGTAGPEFVRRIAGMDDLRERHIALTHSLYDGEDAKLMRVARVFAQLKLVGEVMSIDATVVDEIWATWSEEVVEAFDDDLQIGRDLRRFIEGRIGSSIVELFAEGEDDAFEDGGEKGHSYQKRDGWFDNESVYIRLEALASIIKGHGKSAFYDWLADHRIIARPKGSDRWTSYVPRLTPRRTGLQIDWERLQEVVAD